MRRVGPSAFRCTDLSVHSGSLARVDDVVSPWLTGAQQELHRPLAEVLGTRTAKAFTALHISTVGELLSHVPRRYLTGTETTDLSQLVPGSEVALVADVASVEVHDIAGPGHRQRLEVGLTDGRATLPITFFGKDWLVKYWQKQFTASTHGIFVGKVGTFRDRPQITHPDFVMFDANGRIVGKADKKTMATQVMRHGLVGLYPATAKLPTWTIAECATLVLAQVGRQQDTLPDWLREEADLPRIWDAFEEVHHPHDLNSAEQAAERLIWEEAIATQATMASRRRTAAGREAPACPPRPDGILAAFDAVMPFTLTAGQQEVGQRISGELAGTAPMQRLLQGEVGSGKTLVALRAMLQVVDAGHQAVLLAPTEVLAQQHHATITGLLGDLGAGRVLGAPENATGVALLTGSMNAAQRRDALSRIADGSAGIVIGTHALLTGTVEYADLGLVVVDEQHRFGVEQRGVLTSSSRRHPHELVLTATPIPRTVAMTVFGDLEVSSLRELPAGRADVQTTVVDVQQHRGWLDRAWQRAREEVEKGHQVFVVCPRIDAHEPDERPDGAGPAEDHRPPSATVEELAPALSGGPLRGLHVEALHSRMDPADKQQVMDRFARGACQVLVSTTVVEVGVDVPNATMMVIMDADRFGVSQLHQLRGRIGRGTLPGLCLLVTGAEPGTDTRARIDAVAATRDGFELAELDLAQRREGNVLGSSQAGRRSPLRLLKVLDHAEIVSAARTLAERWIDKDPDDPRLRDLVASTERIAEGDLMEQG
ncbi:ATP-dependent DNA helicase RecG [Acidipropionibacterium jensenii]|uniref:ATP-dependent DNA helicase RecG n=1 Tax=Acidipropionibacterium jensenii TaxID=1749 RepID=UPI00110ABDAF|nr:ATP-dependent DNA helicase RecG [Acidipropionibacterium jensenii]QCV88604.1 ATP-dependent DNA helicase RecG [Acidipropionibacterium jensenii]